MAPKKRTKSTPKKAKPVDDVDITTLDPWHQFHFVDSEPAKPLTEDDVWAMLGRVEFETWWPAFCDALGRR